MTEAKKNPLLSIAPSPTLVPINLRVTGPTIAISSRTFVVEGMRGPIMREGFTTDTRIAPNQTIVSR